MKKYTQEFYRNIDQKSHAYGLWKIIDVNHISIVTDSRFEDSLDEVLIYLHRNNTIIRHSAGYISPVRYLSGNKFDCVTAQELEKGEIDMPEELTNALLDLVILHFEEPSESSELRTAFVKGIINKYKPEGLTTKEYLDLLTMHNKMGLSE